MSALRTLAEEYERSVTAVSEAQRALDRAQNVLRDATIVKEELETRLRDLIGTQIPRRLIPRRWIELRPREMKLGDICESEEVMAWYALGWHFDMPWEMDERTIALKRKVSELRRELEQAQKNSGAAFRRKEADMQLDIDKLTIELTSADSLIAALYRLISRRNEKT